MGNKEVNFPHQSSGGCQGSKKSYLNHTTFTNNTISDISVKHLGWRQISRLSVDGRGTVIETASDIPNDGHLNITKKLQPIKNSDYIECC